MRPLLALLPLCLATPALAQTLPAPPPAPAPGPSTGTEEDEVVTVWGSREAQIGRAFSASEGEVSFPRFEQRPLLRTGELAEVVPGLAATQHSGTGKANQYFLRGFNLDHGTDFSISLDGIPLNLRTSAHGQGYLDINFIIPELIERVSYRKGVASPDTGDFSAAGSARFSTFDHLHQGFAQAELGENGWRRLVAAAPLGARSYVALELTGDDGPWDRPENLEKVSGFASFGFGDWRLSGGGYSASWDSADQIPLRAVESGLIGRLGSIDPDVGGSTARYWANLEFADAAGFSANLYAMHYTLELYSNFTYLLDDPVLGDEFEQSEDRTIHGASFLRSFAPRGSWTTQIGGDVRLDRIDPVGLFRTAGRVRVDTVREDRVEQDSIGLFAETIGEFGALRVNLGARADAMRVDVRSDEPLNSGGREEAILSPKAAVAWRLSDTWEAYASAGRGFHSNDARGTVIRVDPVTGDPAERVPMLVPATGVEAGLRFEGDGLSGTVSLFALDLESELVYVGDAGATEASGASRRMGVEITATWAATPWLTLDGSAAATDARLSDEPSGADRIPLATEYVVTGGATVRLGEAWTAVLTARLLGPAPLIEDNSVRSDPSFAMNGRVAWRCQDWTVALEALNLLDSTDADITYFYASRLPGEAADGLEDIHFHPIPPRSFRVQLRRSF